MISQLGDAWEGLDFLIGPVVPLASRARRGPTEGRFGVYHSAPIGSSEPAGATGHRALLLSQQRNSCPYRPTSARVSCRRLTLASSPEPIFTKTGFAAAGTRVRAQRVRGDLTLPCGSSRRGPFETAALNRR
jgi:hypothetical protein